MAMVDYEVDGHVAIVTLNDGENRFNPDFIDALLGALDSIEQETQASTLVVRSAHEKIFSNGMDLMWLLPYMEKSDTATVKKIFYHLNVLFKRLLTYPLISIAAVSGHAFGAGAIFSCTFDFRFMRSERGYLCLPEIDLGMPFLPGMNAILRSVIPENVLSEMQFTGMRMTAEMCERHGIVKGAIPGDQLLEGVLEFARQIDKRRTITQVMKSGRNKSIIDAIDTEDPAYIEKGKFHYE